MRPICHGGMRLPVAHPAMVEYVLKSTVEGHRRSIDAPIERKVALLLALTPLATPYLFSYDLPFLVVPVLWLVAHYKQRWSRPALVAVGGYYTASILLGIAASPLRTGSAGTCAMPTDLPES